MEADLEEAIENQLGYGDSKAGYIRDAVRQRLEREGAELPDDPDTDDGQKQLAD